MQCSNMTPHWLFSRCGDSRFRAAEPQVRTSKMCLWMPLVDLKVHGVLGESKRSTI